MRTYMRWGTVTASVAALSLTLVSATAQAKDWNEDREYRPAPAVFKDRPIVEKSPFTKDLSDARVSDRDARSRPVSDKPLFEKQPGPNRYREEAPRRDFHYEDHGRRFDRDDDRTRIDVGFRWSDHDRPSHWRDDDYDRVSYRYERVLVCEGYYTTRYVPPVVERRYDHCGRPYEVVIRPGCHERVWVPPQYTWRKVVCDDSGPRVGVRVRARFEF